MEPVVTAAQMKAIDTFTIEEIGIPSLVLMERASLEIAKMIVKNYEKKKIIIVCGTGNNGGDGIAIGRILHLKGYDVEIVLVGKMNQASDQTKTQIKIARQLNMSIQLEDLKDIGKDALIIDAIFGIGLNREIDTHYEDIINSINQSYATIVSVDIPSGLSADNGKPLNKAVKASKTYTIGFIKKGFTNPQAKEFTGDIEVIDIGYPPYNQIKHIMEREEIDE